MSGSLVRHEDGRPRLPDWLRKPETRFAALNALQRDLRCLGLRTVCESARCPNIHECFHHGAATFLILGDACSRSCGFCSVPAGSRGKAALPPDPEEPANVARMAARLELRHVVITSVNRDDLADGGAGHFAGTIVEVRRLLPEARIEVLTPDFMGDLDAVVRVLDAAPDVYNHNVETVERLYPVVRPQADYRRSLDVLAFAGARGVLTKSGLMAGLGEEPGEVEAVLGDLRRVGVGIVTIGQYLQPTRRNLPVARYLQPDEFDVWRDYALSLGFRAAFCGPFVRSSYLAERVASEALA